MIHLLDHGSENRRTDEQSGIGMVAQIDEGDQLGDAGLGADHVAHAIAEPAVRAIDTETGRVRVAGVLTGDRFDDQALVGDAKFLLARDFVQDRLQAEVDLFRRIDQVGGEDMRQVAGRDLRRPARRHPPLDDDPDGRCQDQRDHQRSADQRIGGKTPARARRGERMRNWIVVERGRHLHRPIHRAARPRKSAARLFGPFLGRASTAKPDANRAGKAGSACGVGGPPGRSARARADRPWPWRAQRLSR